MPNVDDFRRVHSWKFYLNLNSTVPIGCKSDLSKVFWACKSSDSRRDLCGQTDVVWTRSEYSTETSGINIARVERVQVYPWLVERANFKLTMKSDRSDGIAITNVLRKLSEQIHQNKKSVRQLDLLLLARSDYVQSCNDFTFNVCRVTYEYFEL